MTMIRLLLVIFLASLAGVGTSMAQGRDRPSLAAELQSPACRADVNFLCGEFVAEPEKMQACLAKNRGELSPACLQTMTGRSRRFFSSRFNRDQQQAAAQQPADDSATGDAAQLGLPRGWTLQASEGRWSGQRYVSPEPNTWATFDQKDVGNEPIETHLKAVGFGDGEEIRFLRATRNWIVVGGSKGDTAFYRRATLSCDGSKWRQVAFEYPASAEAKMRRTLFSVDMRLDRAERRSCALAR